MNVQYFRQTLKPAHIEGINGLLQAKIQKGFELLRKIISDPNPLKIQQISVFKD